MRRVRLVTLGFMHARFLSTRSLALFAAIFFAAGCGRAPESAAPAASAAAEVKSSAATIAMLPKLVNIAYFNACQKGAEKTAKELGVKGKAQGVVVTAVEPDSGAEKAGVMRGDVIREINRQPVKSVKDFERVSSGLKKGENALILIDRRGSALFLSAKV